MGWDVRIPPKHLWQPYANALAKKEVQRLKEYLGAVRGKEPSKMSAREIVRILSAALGATIVALNQFARTRSIRTTADGGIQVFVDAVVRENDASGLLYPLAQSWRALRASYDDYLS